MRNVIVVGSGPAGLTAGLYTGRANLQPLVIEGLEAGGQLMLTTLVENWPGFREGVMGPELMTLMRAQAERFGAEIVQGEVTAIDLTRRPFVVRTAEAEYRARALIIATGASARMLGLPGERALIGHGLSTCATCDGYFFRGQEIAVVGGGDSAMEEAIYLANLARKVTIIHRRSQFRASKIMLDKARTNPRIVWLPDTVVEAIKDPAKGEVSGLVLRNTASGEVHELAVAGVFVAVGHTPNTRLVAGQIDLDKAGYIITRGGSSTNIPGVFACGDVQDRIYRQAITAAGSGCMAAIDAERYLDGVPSHGQ